MEGNPQEHPVVKSTGHDRHCFIVMPYGHTAAEIRWFKGWYEVVIKPAVSAAGYEPKLSAAEEQPNAINDEIRAHLAFDPMVVVDLGGVTPDSEPNPNVMYELGIRHALNLPVVMMSWKEQRLPFDVGNMRVIKEGRDLIELDTNRARLMAFVKAAETGQFYRPMEAVGRVAALQVASLSLSQDSVLGALVGEVRELRETVRNTRLLRPRRERPASIRTFFFGNKPLRQQLYKVFIESGGAPAMWSKLLNSVPPAGVLEKIAFWSSDEWNVYIRSEAQRLSVAPIELAVADSMHTDAQPSVSSEVQQPEPPEQ